MNTVYVVLAALAAIAGLVFLVVSVKNRKIGFAVLSALLLLMGSAVTGHLVTTSVVPSMNWEEACANNGNVVARGTNLHSNTIYCLSPDGNTVISQYTP